MFVKYKTDKGLTVLLEPIDSVVSISLGLWVQAGSRHETPNEEGYAHFVEHMLFKGTEKYSAKEIAQIVDRVGGQHNAATNREYTCYYINVISDYFESSIELLAEMYYRSLFDEGELEKEKKVIIEEIRMYDDTPDELIHDIFMSSMLSSHPLGHSILGTTDSVQDVSREDIIGFFNEYYHNDNTIFVVAGKFKECEAVSLVEKYFSERLGNPSVNHSSDSSSPIRIYRTHIERDLEQIHFCIGTDGLNKSDDDRWALYILSTLLGGSMSSRLFQSVREREGLCYSIYSFHSTYTDNGVFGIYCGTSPDNYNRSLELIITECEKLLRNGITEQEIADVKAYMKGNLALGLESTEVRMSHLAVNEMAYGRYFSFKDIVEKIDNVTIDDFKRVCNRIFKDKRFAVASIGRLKEIDNKELYLQH
ncbi:MAG: pitrilysin family protein [Spirochaetota bacterium]|nr:pitrilysin family protein [Spirochaetota bacterium]